MIQARKIDRSSPTTMGIDVKQWDSADFYFCKFKTRLQMVTATKEILWQVTLKVVLWLTQIYIQK